MSHSFEDDSPFKEDLRPLMKILESDPDWNKRFGAASKLFRLGQERAVDPLIKALQNDPHNEIRRFSADLLGRLRDPRANWALVATLRRALEEKDKTMINHSTKALIDIRGIDLPGILISTVEDKQEFFEMKVVALEILGKLGDNKSVEGLIDLIKNPDTEGKIRGKAIEELIYTGNLAGLQLILENLEKTERVEFQKIVVRALGKTPFKNRTIIFRIGSILLNISEKEEAKGNKKDQDLYYYTSETLKKLAENINMEFDAFMDELITLKNKQ